MRIRQFDVVELKDKNKAIIKKICKRKNYLTEIIDVSRTKTITNKDIRKVIYSKKCTS